MTERTTPAVAPDEDARFTIGLWLDLRPLLVTHGYPEATPTECMEISQALFRLLYRETTLGTRPVDPH